MKTYRISLLNGAAFLMLLCSMSNFSRTAIACPFRFSGLTSFTVVPGGSQSQTWTVTDDGANPYASVAITAGSDLFTVDRSEVPFGSDHTGTFTITFTPGANTAGTFKGSLHTMCKTYELVGTVAASGVANSLPRNVSFTITPNPATDNITVLSSGVRTAEVGIYDLLGKEIASSKTTAWKWDASGIPAGSYIVRITGESTIGEQFAIWRRIIIAR